jgi:adenine-specific DNA-methyltransferase
MNDDEQKLFAEIERLKKELKKKKKYGLVWEEKQEEVVEMCKVKLPVLKEVKNKEIITDQDKPVNLLIEGDNYHALSVLNYTHAKKVDVIYIDPPYNTGNKDFIFNDHYVDHEDAYRHSKWLAFMEKRLKLAKNLLKDSGVVFISIDDNEVAQLKLLMDDKNRGMFGENNFVQNFMWLHGKGKKDHWSRTLQQYILCYAKNKDKLLPWSILSYANYTFGNSDNDPRGSWFSGSVSFSEQRSNKQHPNYFEIKSPSGIVWKRQWQRSKEEMKELLKQKKIFFGLPPKYDAVPRIKIFPDDIDEQIPPNIIDDVESTREAQKKLDEMFGNRVFDYPKPVSLMKRLIKLFPNKDATILDFMAGTGTTGHAVLQLNKEDGGKRTFILCTNNENNNGTGLKIAEDICYPRIKKVIEGYKSLKSEKIEGLSGNLKYFKTDFVDYDEPTDRNKIKLTVEATEMLCVKEGAFEKVLDQFFFKIFKNTNHYTGIIFDQAVIPAFKKEIKNIKGKFSIYVFSLGDETFDDEFKDVKQKVQISPIPEAILRVYRRIYK